MTEKLIADRLGGAEFGRSAELYKFALIKKARDEALKRRPDRPLIDMGVGEPDKPADSTLCDVLSREARRPENRFYADNGIGEFQQAAIRFMKDVYGVTIPDGDHIIHGIGSKPILALLPLGFINPGDITLMTVPGYPVMGTHTTYLGGEVYELPLTKDNDFFPDLAAIPEEICRRAKLLYLNYPNNPTGKKATRDFYRRAVSFAKKNRILIISDAAYGALIYDGSPLSILSVPGAMDCALEIHSLSKAFNMTGWRLAFVTGNPKAVRVYAALKDNSDSGQFRPIQLAGCRALSSPELIRENKERYSRRLDKLVLLLRNAGWNAVKPEGTFYVYVPVPSRFATGKEAADFLIREAGIVAVPWDDAGAYLRFSVTYEASDEESEDRLMTELTTRLEQLWSAPI